MCRNYASLLHRQWEGETFVFHPLTGHTHILNQASWTILSACATRARSRESLLRILEELEDDHPQAQLDESLQAHLEHLCQFELLEPLCAEPG